MYVLVLSIPGELSSDSSYLDNEACLTWGTLSLAPKSFPCS